MRSLDGWVGWVAAVALGLFLITSSVRFAANSLWLYQKLFERNHVPALTGMTIAQLRDVGKTIQEYFNSDTEPLHVVVTINGTTFDLFHQNEIEHMADVKKLFRKTYRVEDISAIVVVAAFAFLAVRKRRRAIPIIARSLANGALLISIVIIGIGIASLVNFDQVFLLFHYIGFPEGNFTFDPQVDYLVRVFPLGFWSDVTFFIGAMTMIEAALIYLAARLTLHSRLAQQS